MSVMVKAQGKSLAILIHFPCLFPTITYIKIAGDLQLPDK